MSLTRDEILRINGTAWDERVKSRAAFARGFAPEDLATSALVQAHLEHLDPRGWYAPRLPQQRVLCLGAGGGRHGPLFAAAGAQVTVVDLSPAMLELDRALACALDLRLETLEASIDDLVELKALSFDLVVQPVSTCYVPDINRVYAEVARVLRHGAAYVSQHKTPTNLQAGTTFGSSGYSLNVPYREGEPLPPAAISRFRESGTLEFLHTWEHLIGGLCRAGFLLSDLVEVPRGKDVEPESFEHRCQYIAPYVRMRAYKHSSILVSP